ncbi:TlpA family protein disulfide reductase [Candidatus Pacearchaeota archaeon]|nr:TlpA family protein disulfide reductase [Candidatus Pacearchaeota archaeon]
MMLTIGVLVLLFFIGCSKNIIPDGNSGIAAADPKNVDNAGDVDTDWKDIELRDVKTGETFKISDFKGKPILLESFAVWCPTCKKQQDEVKKLHEQVGDDVVSVSLDTDPNEGEQKVIEHVNRHGYDWLYVVSPVELTKSLIDQFGTGIVQAPQAPVILVCEDQSARLLQRGVKSDSDLLSEIVKGC